MASLSPASSEMEMDTSAPDAGSEMDVDDGEELFGENIESDYRQIPALDRYDYENMDDEDYKLLSVDGRQAAEEEMDHRDHPGMGRGAKDKLMYQDGDYDDMPPLCKKRKTTEKSVFCENEDQEMVESIEKLEEKKGFSTKKWVQMLAPKTEIENRFKNFLTTFSNGMYIQRMQYMCQQNFTNFEVDFQDLAGWDETIGSFLCEVPLQMLKIFNNVAKELVFTSYTSYGEVTNEINVRISNLPVTDDIRVLRTCHLNQLIRTMGVVTATTNVMPQLGVVKYDCNQCGFILGPYLQHQDLKVKPGSCPECQSSGPFEVNSEETVFRNYQKITLQESPGKVPAGCLPRSKECILLEDLCDRCKPGDEIDVTGIYTYQEYDTRLNSEVGFPVFHTCIMANHLVVKDCKAIIKSLTEEDKRMIQKLSKDHNIGKRIVASIAPSIYGHADIKRGLAMALFGGVPKNPGEKHKIRGDINVLLCGDPGTAKSQFLKYIENIAPRAVYTTGQGASAVGLTAYVRRNRVSSEWTLEAGALVLADQGVCIIDEFDKMNDQDRTAIHEAMEQQSISISKAGIVTSLQARCSVMAAANPIGGRYDPEKTFLENVNLSEPIISRFDVLCVVQDKVEQSSDERLAKFVIASHRLHHPKNRRGEEDNEDKDEPAPFTMSEDNIELIPQTLFKKYIVYARQNIRPKLNKIDVDKISEAYATLRMESKKTESITITPRHIESIIRMAEATAKMHLRDYVNEDDMNTAIQTTLESFIKTQKYDAMESMRKKLQIHARCEKDEFPLLNSILSRLFADQQKYIRSKGVNVNTVEISVYEFVEKANAINIFNLEPFYNSPEFKENRFIYDGERMLIIQTLTPQT